MCTLDLGGGYILPRPPLYYSIETVYILAQEFNNHKSARERENKALLWLIVYTMYIHAYMYTLDMYIAYRVLCAVGLFGWRRLCCPCRCSPSLVSHTRSGFKKKKKFLFFFSSCCCCLASSLGPLQADKEMMQLIVKNHKVFLVLFSLLLIFSIVPILGWPPRGKRKLLL